VGDYNSQYESYYSKFGANKRSYNPYSGYSYGNNRTQKEKLNLNYFVKRFLRELIGVFCLLILILICKAVVTPQTTAVYKYSKNVVNSNYDYTYIISTIKSFNISNVDDMQKKLQDIIETLKVNIGGGVKINEKVKSNYIPPVKGEIVLNDGKNGIDIAVAAGSEVKAVYDGNVKEASESLDKGKYVLIDHGSGIESVYSYLSEISVKKNTSIKKGDSLGKTGNLKKSAEPGLHFDLIYMGETIKPVEYINFNGIN
jgi:murein DD-endopeptidase MepM/ murein hydrolase activator NlpD